MNAYEKVSKIVSANPGMTIADACKQAKVPYHKYSYDKNKTLGIPRSQGKKKATTSRRKPQPRMETHVVQNTRTVGNGLVAFVGSKSEVVEAVREFLKGE